MQGYEIKQGSTAYPLLFLLVGSADHITGLTGATPTVLIRKPGGAFAAPAGAVTEVANGWYQVAGNATDTATVGPLLLHATATGADPTDMIFAVVAVDPQDAVKYGLSALTNPVLTPAQVANAVWADATAGDFTVANSPGKVLVGQLGGAFGAGTSVYTAASLANAPAGSGGGGTDPWATALPGSYASGTAGYILGHPITLSTAQALSPPRAVDAIADASLTVNDALWAAVCAATGKESVIGTAYTIKTPSTGTVIRTFTLDSGTAPTQRN